MTDANIIIKKEKQAKEVVNFILLFTEGEFCVCGEWERKRRERKGYERRGSLLCNGHKTHGPPYYFLC